MKMYEKNFNDQRSGLRGCPPHLEHNLSRTKSKEFIQFFIFSWELKGWIQAFPKGIITKWNASSLIKNLNSGYRFHFLGR